MEMLYRHIETPEFHCRFKWRANSVAFWDNRAAQQKPAGQHHVAR